MNEASTVAHILCGVVGGRNLWGRGDACLDRVRVRVNLMTLPAWKTVPEKGLPQLVSLPHYSTEPFLPLGLLLV